MIEKMYTVEEVAELASVTGRTIRNYLKSGKLVGRKIGGQWRFSESAVQRLLAGSQDEPSSAEIEDISPVYEVIDPYTLDTGTGKPFAEASPSANAPEDAARQDAEAEKTPAEEPLLREASADEEAPLPEEEPAVEQKPLLEEEPTPKEETPVEEEPLVAEEPAPEEETPVEEEPAVAEEPTPEEETPVEEEPLVAEEPTPEEETPVEEEPLAVEKPTPEEETPVEEEPLAVEEPTPEEETPVEEEPLVAEEPAPEAEPLLTGLPVENPKKEETPPEPPAVPPTLPQPELPPEEEEPAEKKNAGGSAKKETKEKGDTKAAKIPVQPETLQHPQQPQQPHPGNPTNHPIYGPMPSPYMPYPGYPQGYYDQAFVQYPPGYAPAIYPGGPSYVFTSAQGQPQAQPQPQPQPQQPQQAQQPQQPQQPRQAAPPAPAEKATATAPAQGKPTPPKQESPFAELSDVGRRVAQFVTEVHDCSDGPQICTVIDMHQSLASAKITSERLADIARQETERGPACLSFVEFDARYYIARYTLFGTSTFLSRCLILIG